MPQSCILIAYTENDLSDDKDQISIWTSLLNDKATRSQPVNFPQQKVEVFVGVATNWLKDWDFLLRRMFNIYNSYICVSIYVKSLQ